MPPTIYIVRHGPTALNDPHDERFRAWSNPHLSSEGYEIAHAAGEALRGKPIQHIICSDLLRTYQTADELMQSAGGKVTPTRDLRPWNLGYLTGQPVNDKTIKVLIYYSGHPDSPIPGGETYHMFAFRYLKALQKMMRYARQHPEEVVVMVVHSRNVQITRAVLNGKPVQDLDYSDEVPPGALMELQFKDDKWVITQIIDDHVPQDKGD